MTTCAFQKSMKKTRKSSGDEIANVNFFYDDIFNHLDTVRPGSY